MPEQLRHGYRNATRRERAGVRKRFLGRGAEARCAREARALRALRGALPVPELLEARRRTLRLAAVEGVHGQEALEGRRGARVLRLCGELLAALQRVPPAPLGVDAAEGQVLAHGDFGPQNLILRPGLEAVAALLDWEEAGAAEPALDLAWAEWIVRTHHPRAAGSLGALFEGYGARPSWRERRAAMEAGCGRHLAGAKRSGDPVAVALWQERLERTRRLSEVA